MISKAEAINAIPEMEEIFGDSSGRINQLKIAPETGIKNFQVFRIETFTPGLRSKPNQIEKAAAEKLGVTPAAVCQYLSKKRGKIKIVDQQILNEINKSAELIIENEGNLIVPETCRICRILIEKGVFPLACDSCPADQRK